MELNGAGTPQRPMPSPTRRADDVATAPTRPVDPSLPGTEPLPKLAGRTEIAASGGCGWI